MSGKGTTILMTGSSCREAQQEVIRLFRDFWSIIVEVVQSLERDRSPAFFRWDNADKKPLEEFTDKILKIHAHNAGEDIFSDIHTQWLASDSFILLGHNLKALEYHPVLSVGGKFGRATDQLLSLKLAVGADIKGADILNLYGPQVTEFGKYHLKDVERHIDRILQKEHVDTGINHLKEWSVGVRNDYRYQVFVSGWLTNSGNIYHYVPTDAKVAAALYSKWENSLRYYEFSNNRSILKLIKNITNQAEKNLREDGD